MHDHTIGHGINVWLHYVSRIEILFPRSPRWMINKNASFNLLIRRSRRTTISSSSSLNIHDAAYVSSLSKIWTLGLYFRSACFWFSVLHVDFLYSIIPFTKHVWWFHNLFMYNFRFDLMLWGKNPIRDFSFRFSTLFATDNSFSLIYPLSFI